MNFSKDFEDISSSTPGSEPLKISSDSDTNDVLSQVPNLDTFSDDIIYSNRNGTSANAENIPLSEAFLLEDEKDMATTQNTVRRTAGHGPSPKKRRQMKNRLIAFNIIVSTLLVLSMLGTFVMGTVAYYTGGGSYQNITKDKEELGISKEVQNKLPKDVVNIALFGLDSRSRDVENRKKPLSGLADTVIILSVDPGKNTVKMVSILRDSWVDVDGTMRKINSAYSYGGAELAIKTINQNFHLNITDYVSVSLHQLWKVIDLVCEAEGSKIKIHVTEAERKQLNYLANSEGFGVNKLKESGYVELDGGQAMTYSRIRKIDSDGVRAMRQQKILNCLFEKAKAIPLSKYPGLLKEVMKNVETSLSYDEIFKFAPLLAGGSLSLESKTIPNDEVVATGKIFPDTRGAWVWKYDLDEATDYVYQFLYNID